MKKKPGKGCSSAPTAKVDRPLYLAIITRRNNDSTASQFSRDLYANTRRKFREFLFIEYFMCEGCYFPLTSADSKVRFAWSRNQRMETNQWTTFLLID